MNEFKLICVYPEYDKSGKGKLVGYRPIWMKHGAYDNLSVKHKAFLNVHSMGCHEALASNESWRRAEKRFEAHMPKLPFQTDEY